MTEFRDPQAQEAEAREMWRRGLPVPWTHLGAEALLNCLSFAWFDQRLWEALAHLDSFGPWCAPNDSAHITSDLSPARVAYIQERARRRWVSVGRWPGVDRGFLVHFRARRR